MSDGHADCDVRGGLASVPGADEPRRHRSTRCGGLLIRPPAALDPLLVGALAAAVGLIGAGRPSFWYDEAATISASYSRSLGQLWRMLSNVDAVHGLYYLFMHGWFHIFPPTEFWSRVPSGLASGGAAAGVVVAGRQFSSRTAAVASGAVCAILPRATWAGIEARPYAFSMMASAWLTVLLVRAIRRDNAWTWLSYGIVLEMSILLDVYLVLLLLTHIVFAFIPQHRKTILVWLASISVVTGCILSLFMVTAISQAHQISWVAPIGHRTVEDVAVQQYFDRSPPFAILSALVVAVAVAVWLSTSAPPTAPDRQLLILAIVWLVLPTGLIVIWSAAIHSIYTPRYLTFTVPAMTLILGVCIARVAPRPWAATALITVLAIAAAPNYIQAQRNPYAKYGMDYSQVADLITAKSAPGDCLLVNDTVTFMPAPMRPLMAARPDAYRKLIDLTLWQRATERNDIFDTNLIPEVVAEPLAHCRVVWIITQADKTRPSHEQAAMLPPSQRFGETPAFSVPHGLGFCLVERWQFNLVQVIKATR